MKRILTSIFAICVSGLFAQQQTQFTQYMNNNFLLNPAEGGTRDYTDIKLGLRKQWQGLEGSPQAGFLSVSHTIKKQEDKDGIKPLAHHGIGGYAISEQQGPLNFNSLYLSYSFHLPLTEKARLSFGVFAGGKQFSFETTDVTFIDGQDNDVLVGDDQSAIVHDLAAGIWFYNTNFYAGVSSFQLTKSQFDVETELSQLSSGLSRHFYFTSGYKVPISEDFFVVPSFVVRMSTPAPIQFDLNAKFRYKDLVWFGGSYRNLDAATIFAGATFLKNLDFGYSYDINISDLNQFNNGSHEILLGYRINKKFDEIPAQFW